MERLLPLAPRSGLPRPGPRNLSKVAKVARACEKCRALRKRCDGMNPCTSCQGLRVECKYSGTDGRKKEDWKARVEALEQRNAYLEQVVEQLSSSRADATAEGPGQQTPQTSSVPSGSSSARGTYQSTSRTSLSEDQDQDLQQLFYAATASHPLLGSWGRHIQHGQPCGNRRDRLPEEAITRRAITAFFQCAATLFYVTTERKSNQLLDKVFHSNEATAHDVCEVAACAAIGSHYKSDEISDEARAAFFYLASTSLNEAFEASHIQGMRIFILLCMSCIMDKSSNARVLIMSALNIARAKMETALQSASHNETENDEYRRTLQTLIFLEGWLSFSLGYRNCLRKNEIDLVHCTVTIRLDSESQEALLTRLIQSYMTRMVILASETQAEMAQCTDGDFWSHADRLAAQLDQWHQCLPPDLHLVALSKPDRILNFHQEKALYLMHMMYIDSRLQVYCRLLKASQDSEAARSQEQDTYLLERLFNQVPRRICNTYTKFSVQLTRIASLLYDRELIMTRCWLVICAVFDACIVLLLGICQEYFTTRDSSSLADLPGHVDTCLTVLRFCGRNDLAAYRLVGLLNPITELWNRLNATAQVQGRPEDGNQMTIEYILDDGSAEVLTMARMTYKLLDLMPPSSNSVWV